MLMTKTIQVAEIISQGGRDGKAESADGGFAVQFTPPSENAEGVTPEHLFAAAYASCFHGALLNAAKRGHFNLVGSTVVGRVALGENERGEYGLKVELRAALPGIAEHDALHLMHQAHSTCPYSRAVRGNIEVALTTD